MQACRSSDTAPARAAFAGCARGQGQPSSAFRAASCPAAAPGPHRASSRATRRLQPQPRSQQPLPLAEIQPLCPTPPEETARGTPGAHPSLSIPGLDYPPNLPDFPPLWPKPGTPLVPRGPPTDLRTSRPGEEAASRSPGPYIPEFPASVVVSDSTPAPRTAPIWGGAFHMEFWHPRGQAMPLPTLPGATSPAW